MDLLRVTAQAVFDPASAAGVAFLTQTGSANAIATTQNTVGTGGTDLVTNSILYQEIAGGTSSITFSLYATGASGTTYINSNAGHSGGLYNGTGNSYVQVEEIMGALDSEPANDNINPGRYARIG
jgi:hypothetical protein